MLLRLAIACLPCLLLWSAGAQAQVKRCTLPDGSAIYTDRQCADIGARERLPPPAPAGATGAVITRRSVCARSPQDLADALAQALQSGDANRIAALYDWTGMGSSTANAVLDRLQTLAERNLLDVQLQYSGADTAEDTAPQRFDERSGQLLVARTPPSRPRLLGLQIIQMQKNGYTAVNTRVGLHRRMDCWWLSL
ncbi:MAG: hypothetical protein KGL91_10750 [Xanthomonadaceae bacterium]|nr:hypothetical protein [Xanthomonadaceae bacterium]